MYGFPLIVLVNPDYQAHGKQVARQVGASLVVKMDHVVFCLHPIWAVSFC